eukprot:gene29419-38513_t
MSTRVSKRSASSKSLPLDDEDEEEDVETSQHQPNKKARTQRVNAVKGAAKDISEDDYDDDDEQVDESKVFETGQIIRIHMENFMCHRKFTMEFGRHLNFINGSNGSGKSAIAGALQICLGARASVTGRGSQISRYVREGADKHEYALIQVTLRNEGIDAYQQDVYGKKITIERKFNKESGAGGYVKSREKKVLLEILSSFNIQVDNPCCVLTQEESKKFIQGSDKEKFQFFMRATGLDTLTSELLDLMNDVVATEEEIGRANVHFEELKKDYKSWKDILTKLLQLEKIDQEINKCYVKIAWAKVQNKVEEVGAETEFLEAKSEAEKVGNEGFYQEQVQQIQQQQQELQGELDSFEEPNKAARTSLQATKNRILDLSAEMKEAKEQKAELKRRQDEASGKRQTLLDRRLKDAHSEERKLLQTANDISSDIATTKAAIEEHSSQSMHIQEQRASLQTRISTCSVEISNLNSDQQKLSRELRDLTSGGNSTEQRIRRIGGDWAVKLMEKISKESFHQTPFGPVGMHVTIQEGQNVWAQNLEKTLGYHLLTGFVVTNREDNIKLKTLMRSVSDKCNFMVFQQPERPRYTVRSVSDIAASKGYNGLVCPIDLLQIQNDLVFNVVVDSSGLESIAYWKGSDQQLNQELTSFSGSKLSLKYDIKHVLLGDGAQYNVVNGLESRQANRVEFKNCLVADSNAAVNALQERIASLNQELDHNQQQKQCLQQELKLVNESLSGIEGKLRVSRDKLKILSKKKQELDGRLSEVQDSNNIDVSLYDSEIADLNTVIEQLDADADNLRTTLDEEVRTEKIKKAAVKEMDEKKDRCMKALLSLEDELKKTIAAQRSFKIEQAQLAKKVLNLEAQLKAAAEELRKKELEYEKDFAAAEYLSRERWPDWDEQPIQLTRKETITLLEKQANAFIQEKTESQKKQGIADITIAEANEKTQKARDDYKNKEADISDLTRKVKVLGEDLKARRIKLRRTRDRYQEIVRNQFETYLKKKNCTGTVRFDFEYDVFMDEITRKETIKIMEDYVKVPEQQGRQFILLTPNNLSHVTVSNQVRVKKMPEPERNASARGPQQQTLGFS